MQFLFFHTLMKRIRAIPAFMKDKSVPKRKKLIIILGILYFLSPIDLIPAPILIFGIVDDLLIWGVIIWYLQHELDSYWMGPKEVKPEKKFRGKKIIEDVNFEVKEDGETDEEDQEK